MLRGQAKCIGWYVCQAVTQRRIIKLQEAAAQEHSVPCQKLSSGGNHDSQSSSIVPYRDLKVSKCRVERSSCGEKLRHQRHVMIHHAATPPQPFTDDQTFFNISLSHPCSCIKGSPDDREIHIYIDIYLSSAS